MNVLIAADMEGIAGIEDYRDCLPSHPAAYARGRRQMTDEVLVAIEALRAGGAERISVGDWHMVGTNVERERMPEGVEVRPIADLALNEAEPSMAKAHGGPLDAVVMIGHHASTPSPRGFCSHTFIWGMEVLLDGDSLSETQTYAQALAAEGIPILVAAGDRWLLEEMRRGRARQRPPGHDQGGRGPRPRALGRPRRRPRRPARGDRRRCRRAAATAARPQLPGRAGESRSRARRSPAPPSPTAADLLTAVADRLPHQPGLEGVPPAGEAAARRPDSRLRASSAAPAASSRRR